MDIIPIQASSVPCERVFSSGKETMAPRRGRITPGFMEKLQMLKYLIRKDASLSFTEGMSWATELIEIKALQKDITPSEMHSYTKCLEVEEDGDDDGWEDVPDDEDDNNDEEDGDEDEEDYNEDEDQHDVGYPEEEDYQYED